MELGLAPTKRLTVPLGLALGNKEVVTEPQNESVGEKLRLPVPPESLGDNEVEWLTVMVADREGELVTEEVPVTEDETDGL